MHRILFILALTAAIAPAAAALSPEAAAAEVRANDALLNRIQRIETGGHRNPASAVGDSGLALGWMQIHPDYFADAKTESPWLPDYKTCAADRRLSRLVVVSYWARYHVRGTTQRLLAHHYGPSFRSTNRSDPHGYAQKGR